LFATPLGVCTDHARELEVALDMYLARPRIRRAAWRAGFKTSLKLNRKDFGLTWNAALETGGFLVGDEVRIDLSFQAVAQ
jgi:polyisoprenoid-binding protein YceI